MMEGGHVTALRTAAMTGVTDIDAEMGQVLTGKAEGRRNERERILILNLGIAACDLAVANEIYHRAVKAGLVVRLDL